MTSPLSLSSFLFLLPVLSIPPTSHSLTSPHQFGAHGTHALIPIISGFPDTRSFFHSYVYPQKPVVVRAGCKQSPAFEAWRSDDMLLSTAERVSLAKRWRVNVETHKKENRDLYPLVMSFYDFLQTYEDAGTYMVEDVPEYLGRDVIMPYALQCDVINASFLSAVMWFSSGGTKSVVHTDEAENILCVFDGEKELVLVDPHKFGDKVVIDVKDGSYSSMDVDEVDEHRYPGVVDVEYLLANLSAGDCLYIPFKWIHQVRSYSRNLAVNVWWNYYDNKYYDLGRCSGQYDPSLTLDRFHFSGFSSQFLNIDAARAFVQDLISGDGGWDGVWDVEEIKRYVLGDVEWLGQEEEARVAELCGKLFKSLDHNHDGRVRAEEIAEIEEGKWREMQGWLMELEQLGGELRREEEEEELEGVKDEL